MVHWLFAFNNRPEITQFVTVIVKDLPFISNSLHLSNPFFGRISSRNFLPIWNTEHVYSQEIKRVQMPSDCTKFYICAVLFKFVKKKHHEITFFKLKVSCLSYLIKFDGKFLVWYWRECWHHWSDRFFVGLKIQTETRYIPLGKILPPPNKMPSTVLSWT